MSVEHTLYDIVPVLKNNDWEKDVCQILATSFKLIVKRAWWSDWLRSAFTKKTFSSLRIKKAVRVKPLFWCLQHRFQKLRILKWCNFKYD